jgi:hypothetical protein
MMLSPTQMYDIYGTCKSYRNVHKMLCKSMNARRYCADAVRERLTMLSIMNVLSASEIPVVPTGISKASTGAIHLVGMARSAGYVN